MGRSVNGLIGAALVAASLLMPSPAFAAPRPPEVTFVTSSDTDRAFLRNFCWAEYDPPYPPLVYGECHFGDAPVPPGRRMQGLDSVHIRIDHPQEPDALKLLYWKGAEWQRPDDARKVHATTRPVVDGSGVSWIVDFELPAKWKRLSLEIRAAWETEYSCPGCGRQWGEWRVTLLR